MEEYEARTAYQRFMTDSRKHWPGRIAPDWNEPLAVRQDGNVWTFEHRWPANGFEGVIVRSPEKVFAVKGAIGDWYHKHRQQLGLPSSHERWIGSGPGRYQEFDEGIAAWESGHQSSDRSDPRGRFDVYHRRAPQTLTTGRPVDAAVAFTDLRGFTEWSAAHSARVQPLLTALEARLQEAFSRHPWNDNIFMKGLGDGVMIVSELNDFLPPPTREKTPRDHLSLFLCSILEFMALAQSELSSEPLALGCGIDYGTTVDSDQRTVHRLFLFGRTDYRGEAVNRAAKLQHLAWNEVILSPDAQSLLAPLDPLSRFHARLPGRGYRISPSDFFGDGKRAKCTAD